MASPMPWLRQVISQHLAGLKKYRLSISPSGAGEKSCLSSMQSVMLCIFVLLMECVAASPREHPNEVGMNSFCSGFAIYIYMYV